jgi:hypothetical protein
MTSERNSGIWITKACRDDDLSYGHFLAIGEVWESQNFPNATEGSTATPWATPVELGILHYD